MVESEVTVTILDPTETLLGYLHPGLVQIEELNELFGLRGVKITHPLFDENGGSLAGYDSLLVNGNKVWRPQTADGDSCLYIILGDKEYNFIDKTVSVYAEEVATELGSYKLLRSSAFSWTVNSSFITNNIGELFTEGDLSGPNDYTYYSGALTPLAILREIENNIAGEFQFRYEREPGGDIIRYIDFLDQIGTVHTTPIEIGYNASNLIVRINETETRIAAGPVGKPQDAQSTFHQSLKSFEDQAFSTSVQIPLYVTTDENGDPVNGPMAYPPYNKAAGQKYVVCDNSSELVASYQTIQEKEGGSNTYPRIFTFESTEENKYNIYWECVSAIREHLKPDVQIEATVMDIDKLTGGSGELFNVGDTVYIKLPLALDLIEARVTNTTKNPRDPANDLIEIGTYKIDFMDEFFRQRLKAAGDIEIT